MLKLHRDELIHSFIYRTQVINGITDFSNIITKKGGWSSFPKIHKGTLHLYNSIDEQKLLYALRCIDLARITRDLFSDPFSYRKDIKKFLRLDFNSIRTKMRTISIKYCLNCIKNDLKEYGYGVMRLSWEGGRICPIHNSKILVAIAMSRTEAIKALHYILRGMHPYKYEAVSYMTRKFHMIGEYGHQKTCEYIAPCLENDFEKFIEEHWQDFHYILFNKYYSSPEYLKETHMMRDIYQLAKALKYERFINFWRDTSEIKRVYTGVINSESLTEDISKSINGNCQNCKFTNCFENPFSIQNYDELYKELGFY